jgi:hypothetical protein
MKSKLHITLSQDGYISNEGTTPRDEVEEFVKNCSIDNQRLSTNQKGSTKYRETNILNNFRTSKRSRPTGDGTTVTILKSEYDGMKKYHCRTSSSDRGTRQNHCRTSGSDRSIGKKKNSDLKRVVENFNSSDRNFGSQKLK